MAAHSKEDILPNCFQLELSDLCSVNSADRCQSEREMVPF